MRGTLTMMTAALGLMLAVPAQAQDGSASKIPGLSELAILEKNAESAQDFRRLGEFYHRRAGMLEEKAAKHERLEKRYATAPASLLAKRGNGWNTPRRQRQLAEMARRKAEEARQVAQIHFARADELSIRAAE